MPAGTNRVHAGWDVFVNAGAVIDMTLRFSLPNLERGTGHAIPTSNVGTPHVVSPVGGLDVLALLGLVDGNNANAGVDISVSTWHDQSGNGNNASRSRLPRPSRAS